jgi:hypothetical protein
MDQKRSFQRRRVLKAGFITFDGEAVACTVRNVSEGGAGLQLANSTQTPERFKLVVETEEFIRPCEVAWRVGERLGVKFA